MSRHRFNHSVDHSDDTKEVSATLTRMELTDLLIRITNALPTLPEGSPERENALITLQNIRWVLMMRCDLTP
jgi:hypothetical protein